MNTHNKEEFLILFKPVQNQLWRFCRAKAKNTDDADDLFQDTILNTLEDFHKIKDKGAFKSFLFSVASNLHKMNRRRSKFKAEFNEAEINQIKDLGHNQEFLTDFAIVYEKLLLLPERTYETMILFHISDLSLVDIRKIQGGSLSGVKLRLKRGRAKLLSMLNSKEEVKMAFIFLSI